MFDSTPTESHINHFENGHRTLPRRIGVAGGMLPRYNTDTVRTLMEGRARDQVFAPLGTFRLIIFAASLVRELILYNL